MVKHVHVGVRSWFQSECPSCEKKTKNHGTFSPQTFARDCTWHSTWHSLISCIPENVHQVHAVYLYAGVSILSEDTEALYCQVCRKVVIGT